MEGFGATLPPRHQRPCRRFPPRAGADRPSLRAGTTLPEDDREPAPPILKVALRPRRFRLFIPLPRFPSQRDSTCLEITLGAVSSR